MRIARHSWVNSSRTLSMRNLTAIPGAVLDEVVGPDVIGALGPQPDARSVRQPKASAFGLLVGDPPESHLLAGFFEYHHNIRAAEGEPELDCR